MSLKDMPKIESPFVRETINGKHICIAKFKDEYRWILDKDTVIATEKFDGTNVSVNVINGRIERVMNRTNLINIWMQKEWFYNGIKNTIDKKYFNPEFENDGQYFGELIGEKINGNPYKLDKPLWLPFNYIKKHYNFRFYNNWLEENNISIDTDSTTLYIKFSNLFKNLKSLWFRKKGIEKAPEGIVFYNNKTGEMCKLRIDMWDWYTGKPHKWYDKE